MIEWTGLHGERFSFSIEGYQYPDIEEGYDGNRLRCCVLIENEQGVHEYTTGSMVAWEVEWLSQWLGWVVNGEAKSESFSAMDGDLCFYYLTSMQNTHHFSLVLRHVDDDFVVRVLNVVVFQDDIDGMLEYLNSIDKLFPPRGMKGVRSADLHGPKKHDEHFKYVKHAPEAPIGPYHDFWLFEVGERDYSDFEGYRDLLGRKDAPLRVPDDIMNYFSDWFLWMRPHNPSNRKEPVLEGFNLYGPTVFRQEHGALLRGISEHFRELYTHGPEQIILTSGWTYDSDADGDVSEGYYSKLLVDRQWLVEMFGRLAEYAKQVEAGTHVLLHLGV